MSCGDYKSEISITFRGFDCSPEFIEDFFGIKAMRKGVKGDPVMAGMKSLLTRSFVKFSIDLNNDFRLNESINEMINQLGGVEKIVSARDSCSPEFLEMDILWRIKGSEGQDGGEITKESINDLSVIGCSLSFGLA